MPAGALDRLGFVFVCGNTHHEAATPEHAQCRAELAIWGTSTWPLAIIIHGTAPSLSCAHTGGDLQPLQQLLGVTDGYEAMQHVLSTLEQASQVRALEAMAADTTCMEALAGWLNELLGLRTAEHVSG